MGNESVGTEHHQFVKNHLCFLVLTNYPPVDFTNISGKKTQDAQKAFAFISLVVSYRPFLFSLCFSNNGAMSWAGRRFRVDEGGSYPLGITVKADVMYNL